jgi:RecA-family ATPase
VALRGDWCGDHGRVRAPGAHDSDRSVILVDDGDGDISVIFSENHRSDLLWAEVRQIIRCVGIGLPYHAGRESEPNGTTIEFDVPTMRGDFPLIDIRAWETLETPSRSWVVGEWIPARQATYLTGPGASGKSLLAQQLCTCVSVGAPFLGMQTKQMPALYVTCEDDVDELHRRQVAICEALRVPISVLPRQLSLASLCGTLGSELATFDAAGHMEASEAFNRLRAALAATGARFVALDNVAHLFAGNENIRNQVAAFCGLLNQLAQSIDGAVLFIGHPNKLGHSFSGSTAWENQVRSRLFMEIPKDDDGAARDPDLRVLRRDKSNYSKAGGLLEFRWHRLSFVRDQDLPVATAAHLAETAQAAADNAIFLECLALRNAQGRHVSERPASNYAPKVFSEMPESKRIGKKRLTDAMDRLFRGSLIERGEVGWDGNKRRATYGLRAKTTAGRPAPNAAPDSAPSVQNEPPPTCSEPRHEPPPTLTPYTSYIQGEAPHRDASPDWNDELWRP